MRAVFAGRHGTALCMLLAVTLVALFHGAALGFELVWDDLAWVNDFHRHTLASLLKDNFTANTLVSYYRPLVAASLNLQLALSHSPVFLHAFNLALHALNLCLLILIASPAMPRGALRLPLAVTVLAVHPVLVEPVVWVSGRFDLMFTSFVLLSLLAALRVRSTARRGLAVALCFLAALCCKESALAYAAVGPVLVAVISRAKLGGAWRDAGRAALEHGLALATALAIYLALRIAVLELALVRDTAFQVQGTPQPGAHALLVLRTFGTYLQMSVLPLWNLAPLHALGDEPNAFSGYAAAGTAALLLALGGLRWPACLPFTVWTLALLPAANLVPFRLDLVQCRYLYFPLFAATLCALHLPAARPAPLRGRRLVHALLATWLVALAATNLSIVRLWRDGVALFSWVVSIRPESRFALENLALAQQAAGLNREAIATERRIAPAARSFQGWLLLARASRDEGELEAAREYFERARRTPAYDDAMQVSALYELALLHRQLGNDSDSAATANEAEALAARARVSARLRDYYRHALRDMTARP